MLRWNMTTSMVTDPHCLDISAILERLPVRYPFLLVDRVLELHPGHRIRALKNVTYNEQYFAGHFPGRPLMPGVIVIEALAQTASLLFIMGAGKLPHETVELNFVGLNKARFRKPVGPGDQLILCAHLERNLQTLVRFSTEAFVGEDKVASAEVMMMARAPDL